MVLYGSRGNLKIQTKLKKRQKAMKNDEKTTRNGGVLICLLRTSGDIFKTTE